MIEFVQNSFFVKFIFFISIMPLRCLLGFTDMLLKTLSMGKQPVYYVQKSYRNEDGKSSTKYVERLGTLEDLEKRHRNKYDLDEILQMLLFTRILYPGSKLSSLEDAKRFIEQPKVGIHQVYRALSILAEESDDIQADVYRRSLKLGKRRDKVIYYDCTNYYFESEEENGRRQYGHSKENRPNPIVQMGLFTDMDGIPLAFCANPGNTAETITLKPLEEKLREKFGLSKVVVCTDGGLSSYDNRKPDRQSATADVASPRPRKVGGACRIQVLAIARTQETVGGPNEAARSEFRRD